MTKSGTANFPSFPENGLFDPDVVASGFVVGDGVVGCIVALPSGFAVLAIANGGYPDIPPGRCRGGLVHSTNSLIKEV